MKSPPDKRTKAVKALDRDGFPPCTMTVDEFCACIKDKLKGTGFRIIAFRVRAYGNGGTLTLKRGEMTGDKANKIQAAAVCEVLAEPAPAKPEDK